MPSAEGAPRPALLGPRPGAGALSKRLRFAGGTTPPPTGAMYPKHPQSRSSPRAAPQRNVKAASARVDTSVAKCCDHAPTHRAGLLDIWASCSHESRRVRADGRRAYRDRPCPPKDHSAREDVEAWAPAAIVARARTPETGGILWPLAQPRPNSCDAPLRQRRRAALSPTLLRLTRPAC